jgi:hypothetical protein
MADEQWDLGIPDRFDNAADDPFMEPDGPKCFERSCQGCGQPFQVSQYFQAHVGEDSPLSVCDSCLQEMIAAGRKEVLRHCGPLDECT